MQPNAYRSVFRPHFASEQAVRTIRHPNRSTPGTIHNEPSQIVTFRSLIALPCTLVLFRWEGKRGLPTTQRHKLEYVRGVFLFLSYTTHFMGLAALPLAEAESIRFLAPLDHLLVGCDAGRKGWATSLAGADRCMLESSFPVDKKSFSYNVHWNATKRLTENLSPAERYSLFYATAVKAYRL